MKKTDVLARIIELLDSKGIRYTKLEHEPVFTSEDAAKIRDTNLSMGAKALVCVADKSPLLIIVPGDKKLDFKKFKALYRIKDLRMASPSEVLELTGLEIGSIPPVGKVLGLKSYFDKDFETKEVVAFNAGLHTVSIKMSAKDLIAVENPEFGDFSISK